MLSCKGRRVDKEGWEEVKMKCGQSSQLRLVTSLVCTAAFHLRTTYSALSYRPIRA